jgi:hypothetical protein
MCCFTHYPLKSDWQGKFRYGTLKGTYQYTEKQKVLWKGYTLQNTIKRPLLLSLTHSLSTKLSKETQDVLKIGI